MSTKMVNAFFILVAFCFGLAVGALIRHALADNSGNGCGSSAAASTTVAYVGGNSNSVSSLTVSVTYSATAGNYLVVGMSQDAGSSPGTCTTSGTVTDNTGANTYTNQVGVVTGFTDRITIFTAPVLSGTTTITGTFTNCTGSNPVYDSLYVAEYSGVASVDTTKTSSNGCPAQATLTLTKANNYVVALLDNQQNSVGAPSGTLRLSRTVNGLQFVKLVDATTSPAASISAGVFANGGSCGYVGVQLVKT